LTPYPRRGAKRSVRNLATERKFVSILRADLHRSSDLVTGLELEDSIARLAPALIEMRSAAHQYGGIVYREMGDEDLAPALEVGQLLLSDTNWTVTAELRGVTGVDSALFFPR
jgi:hypothetical protein